MNDRRQRHSRSGPGTITITANGIDTHGSLIEDRHYQWRLEVGVMKVWHVRHCNPSPDSVHYCEHL